MPTLIRTLAVAFALSTFASAPALAGSQAKTEWKETKKDLKSIEKLTKKYEKGISKGKADKYVADIREWAKGELRDLRAMGIKTKEPKPVHPAEADNQPETEEKWGNRLANVLKDVRDSKDADVRLAAMKKAVNLYTKWEERRKSRV